MHAHLECAGPLQCATIWWDGIFSHRVGFTKLSSADWLMRLLRKVHFDPRWNGMHTARLMVFIYF